MRPAINSVMIASVQRSSNRAGVVLLSPIVFRISAAPVLTEHRSQQISLMQRHSKCLSLEQHLHVPKDKSYALSGIPHSCLSNLSNQILRYSSSTAWSSLPVPAHLNSESPSRLSQPGGNPRVRHSGQRMQGPCHGAYPTSWMVT